MDKMLKRLKWTEIIEGALTALAGLACVIFPVRPICFRF